MISIICPVHNTEKFLNQCIKSVYKQSYIDWELILVNDFSTDNSIDIINKWENIDNRIKSLSHNKNIGVDQARFSGLKHSKGNYLMFLDSDDWIEKDALKNLHNKIKIENADVVSGSMVKVLDRWGIIKSKPRNSYLANNITENIILPELFDKYYISYFGINLLSVSMCGKLYRKDTIIKAHIEPTNFKMGEDLSFNLKLHPYLRKISFIDNVVYYYRYGGMTTKLNPTLLEDIKRQYYLKKEYITKYNYEKAIPYINYELLNVFYSYIKSLFLIENMQVSEVEKFVVNELKDPIYLESFERIDKKQKHKILENKNINAIINFSKKQAYNEKYKYILKKLISKLLN